MKSKKIFLFALAFVLVLGLAACKRVENINNDAVQEELANLTIDKSKDVTVIFWHTMGKDNQAELEKYIAEFKVIYPHITIRHEQKGGYPDLKKAVELSFPVGGEPTMSFSYTDHVAAYASSGLVAPLNTLISHKDKEIGFTDAEIEDFVPGYWAEGSVYDEKGTILNLPFSKSTEALYYNKTFFDANNLQVPKSWDDVKALAPIIKDINPDMTPIGYDSTDNMFITAAASSGVPYTSLTGDRGNIDFNNDAAIEMVEQFRAFSNAGYLTTKDHLADAYTSTEFINGKIAMYVGSTGGARYAVTGASFEAGVAEVPYFNTDNKQVIQQGPNINLFLKKDRQETLAAWLFLKYLTQPEQSARYATLSGYAPVRTSSYDIPVLRDLLVSNPSGAIEKVIIDSLNVARLQIPNYFTSPAFAKSSKARDAVGTVMKNAFLTNRAVREIIRDEYDALVR